MAEVPLPLRLAELHTGAAPDLRRPRDLSLSVRPLHRHKITRYLMGLVK